MNRRSIVICTVVAVLLLAGICWLFVTLFFGESAETVRTDRLTDGVEAVPSDAIFLLEAASLSEIETLTDEGSALGRLLGCIPSSASEWEAALSMHYSSKNTVSPLLVVSIPQEESAEDLMSRILDECGGVIDKRYGSLTVHKSAVPDASFAVCGQFLIASPSMVIVEASLRHLESGTSIKDEPLYSKIPGVSSDRGIAHVNFGNLGKLFSGAAASGYVKYASAFQSFADWGTFGFQDGDSPLALDGKTVSLRRGEKFSDVLLSQRGRKPEAWSIAPYNVSYVLTLPITSFSDYLKAYRDFVAADGRKSEFDTANALAARDSVDGGVPTSEWAASLDIKEAAVFAMDADGGRKVLALRCGKPGAAGTYDSPVSRFRRKGYIPALLGSVFSPSSEEYFCILGEWVLVGGQDEIASLQQSWSAGTYFPLSDYISQTPAAGELREVSCLSLMINTGRYTDVLAGYFKDPYSEAVRRAFGKRNFEFLTVNMGKIGNELGIKASLYREDLMSLPQPSGVEEGNVVVEDIPVPVPEGPFRVKNFIDGSTNWLEQLENNDLRLLGASRNPVWTVKFSTPVCGTVRQIDYLKNDKLQMLFGSEDKIYLLDRLGRKVGRFPISLGRKILLGPDVYDFKGDRNYTLMVLHDDNTLRQYDIDGKPTAGWSPVSLSERIMSLPEMLKVGDGIYWVVRTSYQSLLYDAHGTICADFSKKNKLKKDTEFEPVSPHEVAVTTVEGRNMVLNLNDGSFRKR